MLLHCNLHSFAPPQTFSSPLLYVAGSPVVASSALQGHARQDLNEKLDDLAPGTILVCFVQLPIV